MRKPASNSQPLTRRPTDCTRDRHTFDPGSGWCIHGCGNRDDGRCDLPGGKTIRKPHPTPTESEHR